MTVYQIDDRVATLKEIEKSTRYTSALIVLSNSSSLNREGVRLGGQLPFGNHPPSGGLAQGNSLFAHEFLRVGVPIVPNDFEMQVCAE